MVQLLIPIHSGNQTSAELRSKLWKLVQVITVLIICLIQAAFVSLRPMYYI